MASNSRNNRNNGRKNNANNNPNANDETDLKSSEKMIVPEDNQQDEDDLNSKDETTNDEVNDVENNEINELDDSLNSENDIEDNDDDLNDHIDEQNDVNSEDDFLNDNVPDSEDLPTNSSKPQEVNIPKDKDNEVNNEQKETNKPIKIPVIENLKPAIKSDEELYCIKFPEIPENVSLTFKSIVESLKIYMKACAPNISFSTPSELNILAKRQADLAKLIQLGLDAFVGKEFNQFWNLLLDAFYINRDGVFKDVLVYRVTNQLPLRLEQKECFQRLLNLLLVTCNPNTREEAVKTLIFTNVLKYVTDDFQKQKILDFYKVTG